MESMYILLTLRVRHDCLLHMHLVSHLPLTGKPGDEAEISNLPAAIRSAYPGYMGPGNVFETKCAMVSLQQHVNHRSVLMLKSCMCSLSKFLSAEQQVQWPCLEIPFFSARVMASAIVSMHETMKKLPVIFMTLAL